MAETASYCKAWTLRPDIPCQPSTSTHLRQELIAGDGKTAFAISSTTIALSIIRFHEISDFRHGVWHTLWKQYALSARRTSSALADLHHWFVEEYGLVLLGEDDQHHIFDAHWKFYFFSNLIFFNLIFFFCFHKFFFYKSFFFKIFHEMRYCGLSFLFLFIFIPLAFINFFL